MRRTMPPSQLAVVQVLDVTCGPLLGLVLKDELILRRLTCMPSQQAENTAHI